VIKFFSCILLCAY